MPEQHTTIDSPESPVAELVRRRAENAALRAEIAAQTHPERRQVADLVVRREVVEYRTVAGICACGQAHRSTFPAGIDAPLQYGPGVRAFAVYLTQYQLLPMRRAADLVRELAGVAIMLRKPIDQAALRAAIVDASARVGS